jgi:hypothetical protein
LDITFKKIKSEKTKKLGLSQNFASKPFVIYNYFGEHFVTKPYYIFDMRIKLNDLQYFKKENFPPQKGHFFGHENAEAVKSLNYKRTSLLKYSLIFSSFKTAMKLCTLKILWCLSTYLYMYMKMNLVSTRTGAKTCTCT